MVSLDNLPGWRSITLKLSGSACVADQNHDQTSDFHGENLRRIPALIHLALRTVQTYIFVTFLISSAG